MKKIVSIVLAAVLLLGILPLGALGVSAATSSVYTYTVSNGEVTITGCDTEVSGELVIPETIGGCAVTGIGEIAFMNCKKITAVTIPAGVKAIGMGAFSACENLMSIVVAEGNRVYHSAGNCLIETASKKLVNGCSFSVIPADGSVTSIGDGAFMACSFTSITVPNGVTYIGGGGV